MFLLFNVFDAFESHSGSRMMLRMLPAALNHSLGPRKRCLTA